MHDKNKQIYFRQRLKASMVLIVGMLCCALLTACNDVFDRRFDSENVAGRVKITEVMAVKFMCWEGGCTYLVKSKLCMLASGDCLHNHAFELEPDRWKPESTPRWVKVTSKFDDISDERAGMATQKPRYIFYDTLTGKPISCTNCDFDLEQRMLSPYGQDKSDKYVDNKFVGNEDRFDWVDEGAQTTEYNSQVSRIVKESQNRLTWSPKGDAAVLVLHDMGNAKPRMLLLKFAPAGITQSDISSPNMAEKRLSGISFSPDGSALVWQSCAPRCQLWRFDVATAQKTSQSSHCDYSNAMAIDWKENTPVIMRSEPEKCR